MPLTLFRFDSARTILFLGCPVLSRPASPASPACPVQPRPPSDNLKRQHHLQCTHSSADLYNSTSKSSPHHRFARRTPGSSDRIALLISTWWCCHGDFVMLLPKGETWQSARAKLPPTRAVWVFLTRTRFLAFVALAGAVVLLWRGVSTSASEMQR